MQKHIDRLIEIGQRLDELADEGPSELTALGEELGRIAEEWPVEQHPSSRAQQNPRWLEEMRRIVEAAAQEILVERYGTGNQATSPYFEIHLPNPAFYSGRDSLLYDPKAFARLTATSSGI